jgi:nicotinate-nucleotide adenylyltransferase
MPSKKITRPLRLGLYGGTFDPIHHGHLLGARDVLEQLQLDVIIFIPSGRSPHKLEKPLTPARHRAAMLELALADEPRFWLSTCELHRRGPSFTIHTVRQFQNIFHGAEFYWLIGEDQLPKLHTWERYTELVQQVKFVVMSRGGLRFRAPRHVIRLPHQRRIDISASEIRQRMAQQLSLHGFVPPPVADYIQRHHLYR